MDFKGTLWAAEKAVSDPTGGQARNHKMGVDPALIMCYSWLYTTPGTPLGTHSHSMVGNLRDPSPIDSNIAPCEAWVS